LIYTLIIIIFCGVPDMPNSHKTQGILDPRLDDLKHLDIEKLKALLTKQKQKIHRDSNTHKEDAIVRSMYELLLASIEIDSTSDYSLKKIEHLTAQLNKQCETVTNRALPRSALSAEKKVDIAVKETYKIAKLWDSLQDLLKIAKPINKWETNVYTSGIPFYEKETDALEYDGYFTRDLTTGALYCDDDSETLRLKLFLLSLGTCTVNLIALVANSVYRLAKIITFYELRNAENPTITNLKNYGSDIARLVFGPVILIGMQITAMLGAITPLKHGPHDARKMYAFGESLIFGFSRESWRLAPCFRPDPKFHLFGGKIGAKNQW
jgi:hypothetical protein